MSETPGPKGRARRADILGERLADFSDGRRVAFFGGSFDPPHKGHLAVAQAARRALELDAVLFAPVGAQPIKIQGGGQGAGASFEDRLAMTRLAIAGEPGFEVSLADAPNAQGAPNFSLETLERLRAELGAGNRLFFLMGADSFFGLRQWHRAGEIPFAATLVVSSRPGQPVNELAAALPEGLTLEPWAEGDGARGGVQVRGFRVKNQRGESAELYLLPGLEERGSASEIRQELGATGEAAAREWLPEAVWDYVRAHGLYR
jgi:nicotinate-nucleotide adenylyltransferase